jgi:N-methylhydantoinase A/oxoprolinase/acetone carboxylase beta subunit
VSGRPDLRVGIDVGGTHTDAAVLDADDRLVAKAKLATTADVTGGVTAALDAVLGDPGVDAGRVTHVMLGTTHATNAVLERRKLQRVAVLRLAAPATTALRPLLAWPDDLRAAVSAGEAIVGGGIEVDGRELAPLDEDAVRRFLAERADRLDGVAITGMFAPASPDQELRARQIAAEELGAGVHVSLSHEVGSLGLVERENSTVLNAALVAVAREVASALEAALAAHSLDPTVLFAQNDGTLMGLDYAVVNPVLTIGSGPANSLRGAAFLSGVSDALVADVGGTSTDIGALVAGFPRESSAAVEIGGIRTNFRMPDIVAIAVGGGTVIAADGDGVRVGPQSVGYALPQRALVFGGDVPTLTDAAVAAGRARVGDRAPAAGGPDLGSGLAAAEALIAAAVDRAKTQRADVPLVAVGGGSFLVPDALPGVSEVVRPDHHDVANAIGAAIAQVGGRWEEVVRIDIDRERVIGEACERARRRAIAAGADADRVEIVELEEIPLAYHTEPSVRLRVKAVGPLGWL